MARPCVVEGRFENTPSTDNREISQLKIRGECAPGNARRSLARYLKDRARAVACCIIIAGFSARLGKNSLTLPNFHVAIQDLLL